jgi:hypothetical protein
MHFDKFNSLKIGNLQINLPIIQGGMGIGISLSGLACAVANETFRYHWKCLKSCNFKKVPYCIAQALTNAKKGNLNKGFAFAGVNAYRVERIISVK